MAKPGYLVIQSPSDHYLTIDRLSIFLSQVLYWKAAQEAPKSHFGSFFLYFCRGYHFPVVEPTIFTQAGSLGFNKCPPSERVMFYDWQIVLSREGLRVWRDQWVAFQPMVWSREIQKVLRSACLCKKSHWLQSASFWSGCGLCMHLTDEQRFVCQCMGKGQEKTKAITAPTTQIINWHA